MKNLALAVCFLLTFANGGILGQDKNPRDGREDRLREQRQDMHDVIASIGTREITATPANAASGTPVTLRWRVLPKDPAVPVQGSVEIHYVGLNSGHWQNLPKEGERQVCPLGATTYWLKIAAGKLIKLELASVRIEASCPAFSRTQEQLQGILQLLGADLASYDRSITVKAISLAISPDGISLAMTGRKRVNNFPDIDIKVNLLAYPVVEGAWIRASISKLSVAIGSTATRIAWDIITAGAYEIAKAALEAYFAGKYKLRAKKEIEEQINALVDLQANDLPVIRLQNGSIQISVCRACQ